MTLQDFSQHFKLLERLEQAKGLLASLEAAAHPGAQQLDGMPRAPGVHDRVGDLAAEIADMKASVSRIEAEVSRSETAIEGYIAIIADDQMRMIFRLRFIRCLTWREVAAAVGGGNSESGVRAACYRYIARGGPGQAGRPPKKTVPGGRANA